MKLEDRLGDVLAAYWAPRADALPAALREARAQLDALLPVAERGERERGDADLLRHRSGAFAAEAIDLDALAQTLRHSGGREARQQLARLRALHEAFAALEAGVAATPPQPVLQVFDGSVEALCAAFDAQLETCSRVLALVRRTALEVSGLYRADRDEAFFAAFDWRQLSDAEWACCPPFLVLLEDRGDSAQGLAAVLQLATSGRPFKLVLPHGAWRPEAAAGRAAALQGLHDPGLLFLSLRRLFVAQTSLAADTFATRLEQALASPRPALVSVFAVRADTPDFADRCERSRLCRAFPHYVYDPDRGDDFAACLDLADNPERDRLDIEESLCGLDDDGQPQSQSRRLTFADYARLEPEFDAHFTPLPGLGDAALVPLATYLDLEAGKRHGKRAFVEVLNEERRVCRLQPSPALVACSDDRRQLWRMLRELAGEDDSRLRSAARAAEQRLRAEHQAALARQKAELEQQFEQQRERLVEEAVRELARQLAGIG